MPFISSAYVLLSAAFCRSMQRLSQVGICTPTKPRLFAHLQIDSSELKGGWSPINCARKIPGPLIVVIMNIGKSVLKVHYKTLICANGGELTLTGRNPPPADNYPNVDLI